MVTAVSSAKPMARRSSCRKVAAAAQRQQQHAGSQHARCRASPARRVLFDQHRGGDRGHQRRRAARQRIDQTHVAGGIALDQRGEIDDVDQHRGDDPRPGRVLRQPGERQHRKADQRRADRNQHRGRQRIEPALDGGVPAGVAERGEQHGGEDEGVHGKRKFRGRRYQAASRSIAGASAAAEPAEPAGAVLGLSPSGRKSH